MNEVIENAVKTDVANEAVEIKKAGKPVIQIKRAALIAKVYELDKSKIVTVHLRTIPEINQKSRTILDKDGKRVPCQYKTGEVVKLARQNCLIGVNYQNCVNNQLEREGKEADFEALIPNWGKKVEGTRSLEFWVNAEKEFHLYVALNVRKRIWSQYQTLSGEVVDEEYLKDFMAKKSDNSRQGTEKQIIWIKPKVESFVGIATDGVYYEVID